MIKTTSIAIVSILAVLLIYLFPKQTISPGALSGGHQTLENDCMKCHTMFFGTPGEKCVFCHKPTEIGIVTTAGIKIEKNPSEGKAAFHQLFSADSCLSCHPDHKGRDISKSDRQFSHTLIKGKDIHRCRSCHQGPVDNVHSNSNQECSTCHTMDRWRPATLDHAQYFRFDKNHRSDCVSYHQNNNYKEYTCYGCHEHAQAKIKQEHEKAGIYSYQNCLLCHPGGNVDEAKGILKAIRDQHTSGKSFGGNEYEQAAGYGKGAHTLLKGQNINKCISCHRSPFDNIHQTGNQNCNQCHTTDRWRPATLDHARYFRFDKHHGPDCLKCHSDNNYSAYTCYGCHEHSPGKIEEKHLEEGIRNYQDCAACHPSADEDEAKRIFRSGRYQDPSWNGFEREKYFRQKGYWKSGYNDYEGDDDDRHEDDDDDYEHDDDHDRHGRHDDD